MTVENGYGARLQELENRGYVVQATIIMQGVYYLLLKELTAPPEYVAVSGTYHATIEEAVREGERLESEGASDVRI